MGTKPIKRGWDARQDVIQEVPITEADTAQYPGRTGGTAGTVRTLDTGFTVLEDGTVIQSAQVIKRIDDDSGSTDVIYVAAALPSTATSAASWQIKRITLTSGSFPITIEWADGDLSFDNIYDNREALSYS